MGACTKTKGNEKVLPPVDLRSAAGHCPVPASAGAAGGRTGFDGPPAALAHPAHLALQPYQYLILKQ